MDPLQILERYFQSFIGLDDPKQFFIGLKDYLDYGDAVPEFDLITTQISSMPKELMNRYETQQKAAVEKVQQAHEEIKSYVENNKVEIPAVLNALKEYDDFVEKRTISSSPLPYSLHDELWDIIEVLNRTPGHEAFAAAHIEYSDPAKTRVRHYLPIKELNDFLETKKELERGHEDDLWGAQMRLYELREIVHKGHEIGKGIQDRVRKHEPGATFEMLNFSVIMGEWMKIDEGRAERDPTFFNPKKVRPKAQRFHMYVLAHFGAAREALQGATPKKDGLAFDLDAGLLRVKDTEIKVRRVSDQYDLLRVVFEDRSETGKEWFFDEIAEKVDDKQTGNLDKKYHNAAYQINRKLAEKGIRGFFLLNAHSAKIAPQYLS